MARPNPRFSSDPSTTSGLGTSVSTSKAPSPKQPKIIRTVTAPSVVSAPAPTRPTTTRKTITPTPAGIAAQEGFKAKVQALTAPITQTINAACRPIRRPIQSMRWVFPKR